MNAETLLKTAGWVLLALLLLIVVAAVLYAVLTFFIPGLEVVATTGWEAVGPTVSAVAMSIVAVVVAVLLAAGVALLAAYVASVGGRAIVRQALQKPNESLIALVTAVGGLATILGAETAGIGSPDDYLLGGVASVLALAGGIVMDRAHRAGGWTVIGFVTMVALPVAVLAAGFIRHLDEGLVPALASVSPITWALLVGFVVASVATAVLATTPPEDLRTTVK